MVVYAGVCSAPGQEVLPAGTVERPAKCRGGAAVTGTFEAIMATLISALLETGPQSASKAGEYSRGSHVVSGPQTVFRLGLPQASVEMTQGFDPEAFRAKLEAALGPDGVGSERPAHPNNWQAGHGAGHMRLSAPLEDEDVRGFALPHALSQGGRQAYGGLSRAAADSLSAYPDSEDIWANLRGIRFVTGFEVAPSGEGAVHPEPVPAPAPMELTRVHAPSQELEGGPREVGAQGAETAAAPVSDLRGSDATEEAFTRARGGADDFGQSVAPGTTRKEPPHKPSHQQGAQDPVPVFPLKVQVEEVRGGEFRASVQDVRQVADTLAEAAKDGVPKAVGFELDPPGLGKITVVVATRGEEVCVKFIASSYASHNVLVRSQDALAHALWQRGLSLAGFFVDYGMAGENRNPLDEFIPRGRAAKPAAYGNVQDQPAIYGALIGSGVLDYRV